MVLGSLSWKSTRVRFLVTYLIDNPFMYKLKECLAAYSKNWVIASSKYLSSNDLISFLRWMMHTLKELN